MFHQTILLDPRMAQCPYKVTFRLSFPTLGWNRGPVRSHQTILPDPKMAHGPTSLPYVTLGWPMWPADHFRLPFLTLGWPMALQVISDYPT